MNNLHFNNKQPLVSIAVITYNSSKYVLETLESIKSQTYQNLEVIISDDCSNDNTVNICKNWIEKNKDRFVRIELITFNKNTGIAPNANRALHLAKGSWIKFIAGDDILFSQAIQSNMEFVLQEKHKNAAIILSTIQPFRDNIENKLPVRPPADSIFSDNIKEQLKKHLTSFGFINAPGVFIKRDILVNKFNGFNEKYPMVEDAPLWTLFLTNGYKFHFNPEILIGYRIHSTSICNNGIFFNKSFFISLYSYQEDIVFPLMLNNKFYLDFLLWSEYIRIFKNKFDIGDYTNLNVKDKVKLFIHRSFKISYFIIMGKFDFDKGEYAHPNITDRIRIIPRIFEVFSRRVRKLLK